MDSDKMNSKVVKLIVNGLISVNDHIVRSVCDLLLKGHIVSVPTDTIYGLAGLAQNNWAVEKIYQAKRRDLNKPLSICVGDIEDIPKWAVVTVPKCLLEELLPGPVTLVFERTHELNPNLNPETNLVGVRIPDHTFLRKVSRSVAQPIALTSANYSNANSALAIDEFQDLWPHLRLIVDGGRLGQSEESRLGSTVVDLSVVGHYRIIRRGCARDNTVAILETKYKLKPIS
ncbi:hypothetical protein CHUAL_014062 [Chamberlinius hualienensis]